MTVTPQIIAQKATEIFERFQRGEITQAEAVALMKPFHDQRAKDLDAEAIDKVARFKDRLRAQGMEPDEWLAFVAGEEHGAAWREIAPNGLRSNDPNRHDTHVKIFDQTAAKVKETVIALGCDLADFYFVPNGVEITPSVTLVRRMSNSAVKLKMFRADTELREIDSLADEVVADEFINL